MTITINLPPATLDQLKAEAQAAGKDIETVVREAVESKLARRRRTFAQILKPVHDDVETCGISENDRDTLLRAELKAARDERHAKQGEP